MRPATPHRKTSSMTRIFASSSLFSFRTPIIDTYSTPRPDRNVVLRERILTLAQRHKRYGVGMIHLKLRQAGMHVNYKRVERLYQQAQLQVRRRKRKKVQAGERQPLLRPSSANQVWSMDLSLARLSEGFPAVFGHGW